MPSIRVGQGDAPSDRQALLGSARPGGQRHAAGHSLARREV